MKNEIMTVLGKFKVFMSYKPSEDDEILLRMTACINNKALPLLAEGFDKNDALDLLDEGELEKALFDSTRAGGGAAERLSLSLKKKEIQLTSW